MKGLQEDEVYDLEAIIGSRFVFKQKVDHRFKARLVAKRLRPGAPQNVVSTNAASGSSAYFWR